MSTETPLVATLVRNLHLHIRQRVHAELVAAGHPDLTVAHMYVFQSPGPDGTRPTELAARTNMTKQAMNHLLAGLERAGYIERIPSPTDGRATVLRATARGRDVERVMVEGGAKLEREWARRLSRERVEDLRKALCDIVQDMPTTRREVPVTTSPPIAGP